MREGVREELWREGGVMEGGRSYAGREELWREGGVMESKKGK